MIARRLLLGLVAAVALAGCARVDPAVVAKVNKLQEQYAKEPGVTGVDLSTFLVTESFDTGWRGTITLADTTTKEDQARLVARFFDLATSIEVPQKHFDGISVQLPKGTTISTHVVLDEALATEVVTALGLLPDGATGGCSAGTPPGLTLTVVLPTTDPALFVSAAGNLVTIARPSSFATTVTVHMETSPNESTVYATRELTSAEEGFLATLPAWLAVHRTEWLGVPIDDRANSLIRLGTKTDESTAVRQLAQAARAAGFKQQIDAYLVGTYSPYLSIPRS